ncbi:glucosidase 2 subunit beta [Lycorma delicatula]|uniref:glucosidase 2 subunit beta n=1 Tax=Lycorma delicatula TaxID=130591 RepID=UPI003F5164AA
MFVKSMVMIIFAQVLLFVSIVQSSEVLRLRGVSISKLVLYDPLKDFTCFDGSHVIPFKYVNDDYCDCNDGSDEPGTSACPNGWFHCTNTGHQPLNIPSSRVNDGICDCCDGSDEYVNNNCSDYCSILGEEARIAALKRAELIKTGCELREQLSWKGKKMREEKKEKISSLERDKIEAEAIKLEKETIKKEVETAESAVLEAYRLIDEAKKAEESERQKKQEEQEAFEAFSLIDSNNDEKIQVEELKVRQTFDQNKDGVVSDDELKFFMGDQQELTWNDFLNSSWGRMKPFFMLEKGIFQPPTAEQDKEKTEDQAVHPDLDTSQHAPVNEEQEEEWEGGEGEPTDEDEEEDDGEGGEHEQLENDTEDKENLDAEDKSSDDKPKYDKESQKIIDEANKARAEYENAERSVRDVERELRQLQDALNKDYGHEDEFAPLDGECFEYNDREYTYKLCPFDQVSQRPRSGGAETRLGTWKSWVGRDNAYSTMLYDHGQSCWNGPQRSAHVEVTCGLENAVTFAAEPNRCEYVLHFSTPSACWPEVQPDNTLHDEL